MMKNKATEDGSGTPQRRNTAASESYPVAPLETTLTKILEKLADTAFWEGEEIDPNEDYATDGWTPDVKEALAEVLDAFKQAGWVDKDTNYNAVMDARRMDVVHLPTTIGITQLANLGYFTGQEFYIRFKRALDEWDRDELDLVGGGTTDFIAIPNILKAARKAAGL